MCWSARRGAHIEPTRRSAVAVTITTWPDSASTKCISACSSWRGVAEGIRRAGHFGIHQAQCPIDHANLQGARTRARREGSERPRAAMTLGAARYPLARPGMALPRRPRQSRARPHVRVEDLTEIAALSHAEVLRPVPDRQRFFERILKRSPVAHRVTCLEQSTMRVAARTLFSLPCPLALLLPVLWIAAGTTNGNGRGSQACAAMDCRFRGGRIG